MYEFVLAYDAIEEVEASEMRFHLCLLFEAAGDFNFPFRPLLHFIAEHLKKKTGSAELNLPEYLEYEDFVSGELKLPDRSIGIYFEHSLSYASFSSNSQEDLELLEDTSGRLRFRHAGYGLKS